MAEVCPSGTACLYFRLILDSQAKSNDDAPIVSLLKLVLYSIQDNTSKSYSLNHIDLKPLLCLRIKNIGYLVLTVLTSARNINNCRDL